MPKALHVGSRHSAKLPSNDDDYLPCVGGLVSDDGAAVLNVFHPACGDTIALEVCANGAAIVLQLDGVEVAELAATLQDLCRPEWMDQHLAEFDQETAEIAAMFEKAREVRS